jgi:DNA helicase II / ATP-dependent DNA helicase PcrA
VQSQISKAKANGRNPQYLLDKCADTVEKPKHAKEKAFDTKTTTDNKLVSDQIVAKVYLQYQQTLQENNSLDFDDLLVYGVRLFKENRNTAKWCQHILVDEL